MSDLGFDLAFSTARNSVAKVKAGIELSHAERQTTAALTEEVRRRLSELDERKSLPPALVPDDRRSAIEDAINKLASVRPGSLKPKTDRLRDILPVLLHLVESGSLPREQAANLLRELLALVPKPDDTPEFALPERLQGAER
jgi:hypothetical protein